MPCYFSGIFFVKDISQYKLNCHLIDENHCTQDIEMIYFFPSASDIAESLFWDPEGIELNNVYFITRTVTIFNSDYRNPMVRFSITISLIGQFQFQVNHAFKLKHYSVIDANQSMQDIPSTIINHLSPSYITMTALAKTRMKPTSASKKEKSSWQFIDVNINQYVRQDNICFL